MSVPSEHIVDTSPNVSEKRTCSYVAAGGSVTINQMVRDFIIAKTIGMNGSDRVGDSVKGEQDSKERRKKKKKKKKHHKSRHKDGSSKHRRHRHRDCRSRDTSSKSDLSDYDCTNNVEDAVEETVATSCQSLKHSDGQSKSDPLTVTKKSDVCMETSQTNQGCVSTENKEALLNIDACNKYHTDRQTSTLLEEQTTKTNDMHCSDPSKSDDRTVRKNGTVSSLDKSNTSANTSHNECLSKDDHVLYTGLLSETFCGNEADQINISADSQHSSEAMSHSHKENTSSRKHSDETRKLTCQDDRHECGVSSRSRQYVDNDKMSCSVKKQLSSRDRRSTRDGLHCDKTASSRKRSPSVEAVMNERSMVKEDGKSDDVVFIKKVSARDMVKTFYSRGVSNSKKSYNREQKSNQGSTSNRSIVVGISDKHDGSKRRYDSGGDEDSVPQYKTAKERRHTKESSVILLSDDEVDTLSEEMAEKLHKRLTTSMKKSKELQAERQLNLADNLKTEQTGSHGSELVEEPLCCNAANTQTDVESTSAYSQIVLPTDSGMPHGESTSTSEQTAAKSTALGLFGKKTLKFGLKISESSAALISKGVKNSQASGKSLQFVSCLYF